MTRLVVVDIALLAVGAAHALWVSRTNHGSRINVLFGPPPSVRQRRVTTVVVVVTVVGLSLGTAGYGWGTRWVNLLVILAGLGAVDAAVQVVDNRAVDRQ